MDDSKSTKKYAYEGKMFNVTEDDYNRWCATFHAIPDVRAVLFVVDHYYAERFQQLDEAGQKALKKGIIFKVLQWLGDQHSKNLIRERKSPSSRDEAPVDWETVN